MNNNDISGIEAIDQTQHQFNQPFQLEEVIYESTVFPSIFYAKKGMKQLLEQRSQVSSSLSFSTKKSKPLFKNEELHDILIKRIIQIFEECPSPLDSFSLITFDDCLGFYTFFSTDGKYVPLCKSCNTSIYTVTRSTHTKLICCNLKCKKKVLGESFYSEQEKGSKHEKSQGSRISNKSKNSIGREENEKKVLSQKDMDRIRKAAKKIVYEN